MKTNHASFVKRSVTTMFLAMAFALLFITFAPHPVKAASTTQYGFAKTSVSKVKISGKKIKILGAPYNTADYEMRMRGWYTFKINSKTKFRQLVNTETGKTKKVKKGTALKKLKKKKFIAVYIKFTNKGIIKEILFGV